MATLKARFEKWKTSRSGWQKAGDIVFWLVLILMILPGPRKVISTGVNKVVLLVKNPGVLGEQKQVELSPEDYRWVLRDRSGERVSMESFRGSVVFLNFWATWCPPCVAELPEIRRAYEKHGDDVVFLLVTGEEPDKVEAFMEKHGYDLPVYYPASAVPENLSVSAYPTTFILSPEGKIVSRKKGAANWDSRATTKIFQELFP